VARRIHRTFGPRAYDALKGVLTPAGEGVRLEGVRDAAVAVRRARIVRQLTVRQVAAVVGEGVSHNTLRRYFDGGVDVRQLDTLLALCRALRLQLWLVPVGWDGRPEASVRLDGEFVSLEQLKERADG
jgi:DNA-binding Xre family transcriptional regulator